MLFHHNNMFSISEMFLNQKLFVYLTKKNQTINEAYIAP